MGVYNTELDRDVIRQLKQVQWTERVGAARQAIPADGNSHDVPVVLTSTGDFLALQVSASWSCLQTVGGALVDYGVCPFIGQLLDSNGMLQLFNVLLPLNILFAPGHTRDATATNNATTAPIENALFYPSTYEHLFLESGTLTMRLQNISNATNYVSFAFWGIRLKKPLVSA